jgi:hypothetical protein
VYDAETMRLKFELTPGQTYGANNKYGVRIAVADMNGDGLPDVVTAPGRVTQPVVKIFSGVPQVGVQGALLQTITAANTYGTKFKDGVFVAAGDVNGDGMPEVILAPGRGAANIKIYANTAIPERTPNAPANLPVSTTARTFNAFPDLKKFNGGATVAVGDLNGDADGKKFGHVVVAMGSGLAAQIRAFDASQPTITTYTKILDPSGFKQGLNVATGDIDGDGSFEIVTGAGSGGSSWVRVYDVNSTTKVGTQINSFRAFPLAAHIPNATTRVTLRDVDDDGDADIFAVQGQDGRSGRDNPSVADRLRTGMVKRFNGLSAAAIDSVFSSSPDFFGGGLNLG